jgi:hypothetical protein
MEYDWDLSKQSVEILLQLRKQDRIALIQCFDGLAHNPFSIENAMTFELEGKSYHTVTQNRFLITYTVDHPVRMVHVLSVE